MMKTLNRTATATASAMALALGATGAAQADVVNVFNWSD